MSGTIDIPCIRCGACCRWEGEVKITDAEITRIAAYLQLSETDFINTRTQLRANRQGLAVKMLPDGTCIFLHNNECSIHPVKPKQCANYPLKWHNADSAQHCQAVRTLIEQGMILPD